MAQEFTTLITASELAGQRDPCILDCRFDLAEPAAGRSRYRAGHIPGAHYLDLDHDLSAPVVPGRSGRHPLPDRNAFGTLIGRLGIAPKRQVVVYDDAGGAIAGRAWWLLRWLGHARVALLDGGMDAWLGEGRPLEAGAARQPDGSPYPERRPLTRTIGPEELPSAELLLLDARTRTRFRGETEPIDPVAGHIPGARSAPFEDNLADGRFRTPRELQMRFAAFGDGPFACYCGSGVTAAHNVLAMVHAGLPEPALYPGSWSEWIADPERPIAIGE